MQTTLDKSGSFVASQFARAMGIPLINRSGHPGPAITISHQTGAGAHEVAERLAGLLKEADPNRLQPWTVLDRQLVERALEEHHLPPQLAKKMPEDKRSYVDMAERQDSAALGFDKQLRRATRACLWRGA